MRRLSALCIQVTKTIGVHSHPSTCAFLCLRLLSRDPIRWAKHANSYVRCWKCLHVAEILQSGAHAWRSLWNSEANAFEEAEVPEPQAKERTMTAAKLTERFWTDWSWHQFFVSPDLSAGFLKASSRASCIAVSVIGHWGWWFRWPSYNSRVNASCLNCHLFFISLFFLLAWLLSRYNDWLRAGRCGIESLWGRDFPAVQTGPGAHSAYCKMGTGSFPGVKCGRGFLLTTHLFLVPRSWKSRVVLLPTLWATPGL